MGPGLLSLVGEQWVWQSAGARNKYHNLAASTMDVSSPAVSRPHV